MTTASHLLIVRHAIAVDRDVAEREGIDDAERALTEKGAARMRQAAGGLANLLPALDIILTSPYRRAVETADILAEGFPDAQRETLQTLAPGGDPEAVLADRRTLPRSAWVAVVGHEPDLGLLASVAVSGGNRPFVSLKKGGCCLIAFAGQVRSGKGQLVWSLPPRVLRRFSKR